MALNDALDSVRDSASRTADTARDAFRNARDAYADGRKALPGVARTARKAFDGGLDQLRSQGGDAFDTAGDQFDAARHYVVDQVQEHPLSVTFAALGAGFVLGLLFAGSRR